MIGLAVRLALASGREQVTRLVITAAGVAVGVLLLLLAAVTFPAFKAHEARDGWTDTSMHNVRPAQDERGTDPLLWRLRDDGFAGHDLLRVDVAALGPRAPVPPGLTRLPGPGELAVSPALRRLIAAAPGGELADRFPGRITTVVGDAALRSPDALVAFVGYDATQLDGRPGVERIRSIESAPRAAAPTRYARALIAITAAGLLVPILVLIATATRLAAARREQRMAAMRLVGALPRQIRVIAATEAAFAALGGTLAGFAGFLFARPVAAHIDLDGSPFFPADLRLPLPAAALIGLGIPLLAAVAAALSLRRVHISPLGVSRQAPWRRGYRWRLIPLAAGIVGFVATLPILTDSRDDRAPWLLAAVMALLIAGIVIVGPWLTKGAGRLLVLFARRPSTMLAGYRLSDNPAVAFRSISGLVLAVFLVTASSTLSAATLAQAPQPGRIALPTGLVGAAFAGPDSGPLTTQRANTLIAALRALPGVTAVVGLRTTDRAPGAAPNTAVRVLTRCADLRTAQLADCAGPATTVSLDASGLLGGDLGAVRADDTGDLPSRPLLGVLVATDGTSAAIETARTAIETATIDDLPTLPWTTTELKGHNNHDREQLTRISNAILLVTLTIAGLSLAVAVTGGIVERRRPFALLRLAGMRAAELSRVVITETAAPLLATAATSVLLGLATAAEVLHVNHIAWQPPAPGYWATLGAGLAAALLVALTATIPLHRMTSLETTRFE
jgi:hypothetical protein